MGAVIVHENQVIGSGFHEKAGLPHAERKAIADGTARGNAALFADSTLYVTLEPCSTTGKTPPCTEAILEHHFQTEPMQILFIGKLICTKQVQSI